VASYWWVTLVLALPVPLVLVLVWLKPRSLLWLLSVR
jgi:hypothetical protein